MLRNVLRLLSVATALFFAFLCTMLVSYDNEFFPLDTTRTFTLGAGTAEKADEVLAGELDTLARKHGLALYKRENSASDHEQNLLAFGDAVQRVGEEIPWFDPNTSGSVLSWESKKNEALSGYFMADGPAVAYDALVRWSDEARIVFQWENGRSVKSFISTFTFNNGVGFAAVSVLVTLGATIIVWYVSKAKSGALRLLAGVSPSRIIAQDARQIAGLIYLPMWGVWLASLGFVAWRYGAVHLPVYACWSAGMLGLASIAIALCIFCVALLGRPRVDALAERRPPLSSFVHMGWMVRAVGVLVAVVVIPYSVQYVSWAKQGRETVQSWANARQAVTFTMSNLDLTHTEEQAQEYRGKFRAFLGEIGAKNLAATSVLLEDYGLPEEVLGTYDGVAVIDSHFLSLMAVQNPPKNADFTEIDFAQLPPGIKGEYFEPTRGIITSLVKDGHAGDLKFYEYRGSQTIPVVKGTLTDAMNATVCGKLIVYVEDSFDTFTRGILEATISNGQSFFTDADAVRAIIDKYALGPYFSAVHSAASQITVTAHEYRNQAIFGISAGVLAIIALLVAVIEAAQIWAATNRRRIFVMHSSGKSLAHIVKLPVIREIFFMTLVGIAAAVFSAYVLTIEAIAILAFVSGTVLATSLIAGLAYLASARLEFHRATKRKD